MFHLKILLILHEQESWSTLSCLGGEAMTCLIIWLLRGITLLNIINKVIFMRIRDTILLTELALILIQWHRPELFMMWVTCFRLISLTSEANSELLLIENSFCRPVPGINLKSSLFKSHVYSPTSVMKEKWKMSLEESIWMTFLLLIILIKTIFTDRVINIMFV